LELISAAGSRWVPYRTFHTGYKQMILRPDELVGRIRLPRRQEGWTDYYRKVGTRRAQAISKVCFAGSILRVSGRIADVRIALGSVAPTVVRGGQADVGGQDDGDASPAANGAGGGAM